MEKLILPILSLPRQTTLTLSPSVSTSSTPFTISAVADNLIENVKYKVEEFTGMEVDKINIFVEGVRVID